MTELFATKSLPGKREKSMERMRNIANRKKGSMEQEKS
jgi:hypothetical protein